MLTISALRLCTLAAAFTGSAVPSFADIMWHADPSRSNVTLSVSHLLIARITGTIPIASATIVTTDGASVPLIVDAMLTAAALNTRDPQRDAQLRSDKFFDVAAFPTISFASERISETGPHSFTIDGELTMRGVSRAMRLNGHVAATTTDAQGRRRVRYEATGNFRRSDYGMAYARGIVGNTVALTIVLEAVNDNARL